MPSACKVLVVDPDHSCVLQLANVFRKHGWETVSAGDAVLAQSVVRKENPSAIVVSSFLPGGGAVVVVRRIRSSIYTVGTPVIVVAKPGGAKQAEFLAAGSNDFVQKFDAAVIGEIVRKHVAPDSTPAPTPVLAPKQVIAGADRIAALSVSDILDSAPSKLLDAITELATRLLGAPTALLSIVDKDRQFFKSQAGLPEPWSSARQTPISHSFCQWVVSSEDELVVEDARKQPGLQSNLAISDLGVIAYAGIPVFAQNGPALGSFCAIDSKPRAWTQAELDNLRNLARMAEAGMLLDKMENSHAHGRSEHGVFAHETSSWHATGIVILNATQILLRGDIPAGGKEYKALLAIIEEQAEEMTERTVASAAGG